MSINRFVALMFVVIPLAVAAEDKAPKEDSEPKLLSGMSVLGNNEAPKALSILAWKSSEAGMETDLKSTLLNEDMAPVDREVFQRQLDFYEVSKAK